MGGWSREWQFSLTLCSENVLTYVGGWVVQKSLKTPLRNIKIRFLLSRFFFGSPHQQHKLWNART